MLLNFFIFASEIITDIRICLHVFNFVGKLKFGVTVDAHLRSDVFEVEYGVRELGVGKNAREIALYREHCKV